ncbi:MAG: hypothetical protein ABI691_17550 [Ginsengibacter sp.]
MKKIGWYAIISGLLGLIGYGFIIAFLISRSENNNAFILMNRLHDIACAFQFLLLVPVVSGVHKLLKQTNYDSNQRILFIGIIAASATALCLLLIFPKLVSEIFYMIPQGIFGVWLIAFNWSNYKFISKGLRIFGIIVGIGLVVAGSFPIGFGIFVSMDALRMPAAPIREFPQTSVNNILHILFFIGSFTGVLTLPFWTIFFGKALLGKRKTIT